ncbi:TetR/AcrR family transcriptional regulator [Schleiferilactobacillus shenzhenensis]|uniref:YerO n=1 Tax=Schleiferilactobacillus shenzhenensis LY-73 TaxID=1231336 RepID=U4TIQ1_9LACO|nr:TetR/AcrR family transcriptional regulator [Schleiferilactobacillus shenzhenensis]ERL64074.1 YerO [Schleiferilactobacillus shenzhenensis LY-73]
MAIHNINTLFADTLNTADLSQKQRAVLDASLALFSEKGFAGTTTGDIAARAGVSEGTVYKQFKTKEAILTAILAPVIQQVIPRAAGEFSENIAAQRFPHFTDFLRFAATDRLTFVQDNAPQLRVLLQEVMQNPALLTTLRQSMDRLLAGPIGQTLRHFQETGEVVDWPLLRIIRFIVSALVGYALPALLMNTPLAVPDVVAEVVPFLVQGLAPASRTRAKA